MTDLPIRKTNRLKTYDYSENGAYFITLCTKDKKCILSHIVGGGVLDAPLVKLTKVGCIVDHRISEMNRIYQDVQTVKYAIMPNHIHLLIHIMKSEKSGPSRTPAPTNHIIPQYISTLKRFCNRQAGESLFQRSYHDHVIRDQRDYDMMWQYIDTNPARWEEDCFYTED